MFLEIFPKILDKILINQKYLMNQFLKLNYFHFFLFLLSLEFSFDFHYYLHLNHYMIHFIVISEIIYLVQNEIYQKNFIYIR
jgi:hypothetical protein